MERVPPRSAGVGWGWTVASAAVVGLAVAGAVGIRGLASRDQVPGLLPLVVAWALGAAVVAWRGPVRGVAVVLGLAVAARAAWVGTPLLLSDDLYRYLFEGRALSLGHDVFRTPPAALPGVDDGLRALVNHPEIPSVYPPLALWWFRLLAVAGTVPAAQAVTALADVVTVAAVAGFGSRRGALLLALHPLAVVESAGGAHVDVPAITLATLALAAHRAGRPGLALAAATLGTWTKLFPVVLGLTLLRPLTWRARAAAVLGGVATGLAFAAPHLSAGPHLLTGLRVYGSSWEFSGFAYPWLAPVLGGATRPALAAVAAAVVLAAHRATRDPAVIWLVAGTTFCLLSPTVHPWYVLWALVPSAFLGRGEWSVAGVGALASYAVLGGFDPRTGQWAEVPGLWWLVWGTAVVGAPLGAWLARQPERSDPSPTAP
jgi:hypothetical protein